MGRNRGTSVSAPYVAGVFALIGLSNIDASFVWASASAFNDVTSGANASECTPSYLCTAGPGYDGPTGLGTPNGALLASPSPAPRSAPADAGAE